MVYTSGTLSLTALELLVHVDPAEVPGDLVAIAAEIPDDVEMESIDVRGLPRGWRRYPAPADLQALGTEWIRKGRTAILAVPSAVVPRELNYLINPVHRNASRLRIRDPESFRLDPRLRRRR